MNWIKKTWVDNKQVLQRWPDVHREGELDNKRFKGQTGCRRRRSGKCDFGFHANIERVSLPYSTAQEGKKKKKKHQILGIHMRY